MGPEDPQPKPNPKSSKPAQRFILLRNTSLDARSPIRHSVVMRTLSGLCLLAFLGFAPSLAEASDAKSRLLVQIQVVEDQIANTKWNLNNFDQKKQLQATQRLLSKTLDRVLLHEVELQNFPCDGLQLDPKSKPIGLVPGEPVGRPTQIELQNGRQQRLQTQLRQIDRNQQNQPNQHGAGATVIVAAQRDITDTDVELISKIVILEHKMNQNKTFANAAARGEIK